MTPSILETRLAAVLMGELFPRQDLDDTYVDIVLDDFDLDDDYYAAFELVLDADATTEFVRPRDTSHDHVVTVKFSREALDVDTLPMPLYSAPYEKVETTFENTVLYSAPVENEPPIETPPEPVGTVLYSAPDTFEIPVYWTSYENEVEAPLYSTPYEKVEASFENALPMPLHSVPFERVDLGIIWPAEPTDIIAPPRRNATRVLATIVFLGGALLLGVVLVLFAT